MITEYTTCEQLKEYKNLDLFVKVLQAFLAEKGIINKFISNFNCEWTHRYKKLSSVVKAIMSSYPEGYIKNIIDYAFLWDETDEGMDFWFSVHSDFRIFMATDLNDALNDIDIWND